MSASHSSEKSPAAAPNRARRGFFLGAAAAGAAGAVAVALPGAPVAEPVAEALPPPPEKGGGYTLSAHVQHYYKTARV